MKEITVLFGNYGSGKTQLALNIALHLRRQGKGVSLVDFDIVNPYFRSSGQKDMLETKGIRVITPVYANTAVDLPTLPPDIYAAFQHEYAVFDCGGDPVGATALGTLKAHFDRHRSRTEVLYVINTLRPFQNDAQQIMQSFEQIQKAARLNADGFVLNSNLGSETTGEELIDGYVIVKELSQKTGVPLLYISGTQESLSTFKKRCPGYSGEYIIIEILTRPSWM